MPHPAERRLGHLLGNATWLQGQLPRVLGILASVTRDGYPTGHMGDGGASSSSTHRANATDDDGGSDTVSRPTENALVAGDRWREQYATIDRLAAEADVVVTRLADAVESVKDPGVDTQKLWSQHRCSGGEGDWANPACTSVAVRSEQSTVAEARLPLCWACRKRRQRWLRQQEIEQSA